MDPYQPLMYGFRNSPQYAAFQQVRANLQAEINHLGAIANNARASGLTGAAAALQGIIAAHTAQIRIAGAAAFQSYLNTLARTAIPEAIRALGLFFNNTIMPLLYHIPTWQQFEWETFGRAPDIQAALAIDFGVEPGVENLEPMAAVMNPEEQEAAGSPGFSTAGAGWGGSSPTNEGGIATIDSSGKISWSGWGEIPIAGARSLFGSKGDDNPPTQPDPPTEPDGPGPDF